MANIIKKFDRFNESNLAQTRQEEMENRKIDQMLRNGILFQKMQLDTKMRKLEKEKAALIAKRDADTYVTSNPNLETNPVLVEYEEQIAAIDAQINDAKARIEKLEID
jgi:hypothetical protein